MALVAVNKDGTEVIGDNLVQGYYTPKGSLILDGDYFASSPMMNREKFTHWICPYYNPDEGCEDVAIYLPKGSIEKLIGRKLVFEDGPVEI